MTEPLRIALAGLGTVGAGVIRLIETNADLLTRRAGREIRITAVSARDRGKDRGVDLSPYAWEDDMTAMAARDDVDVVVELVGGSDGPALTLARRAVAQGKSFVTANKAMVAHHGLALAREAEAAGVAMKFEAAVAGGIPVIKGLREGAAANAIERVYGILNGTCNYILSTMEDTGADFADVLAEAQAMGYAEADPSFDIDGIDAGHKLSIMASIAFGTELDFANVGADGIRRILSRLVELDLDPSVFPDGACAQAKAAEVHVLVLRRDIGDLPAFQLFVTRDFGEYFWEALLHAGSGEGVSAVGLEAIRRLETGAA